MPYPNMILDFKKMFYPMNNLQYEYCKTRLEFDDLGLRISAIQKTF